MAGVILKLPAYRKEPVEIMRDAVLEISFVIVNWNTRALLIDCLNSIQTTVTKYPCEIFVVDNGSEDGSTGEVRKCFGDTIHIIENRKNLGFARANNQAISKVHGRYVVLLNTDTVLGQDTINKLVCFLEKTPRAAMAGPRMHGEDGKLQNSFDNFPSLLTELFNKSILRALFPGKFSGKAPACSEPFEVDSLIGACIAVRAEAIKDVGLLDEDYFFFLEETDWCLRMKNAGWKIFHHPCSEMVHLQGRSKKRRPALSWIEYYRSLYKFFKKHRSAASYFTLRVCRFIKLIINFVLTVSGFILTLGGKSRYREKTVVYACLLWWHIKGCPDDEGLEKH